MKNNISINLKKDEILVKINQEATYEEVIEELTRKLPKLKTLYKEEKTPIHITGKPFDNAQMDEIRDFVQSKIDVDVNFDMPKDMGIHVIKNTFEEDLSISETKYVRGAIRSGTRIEFEKSVVVIGDLNAGAEVIAGGNIIVTGILRGLAHAGAKGNTKAIIATKKLEAPQIRIANVVKEFEKEENIEPKQAYAYIEGENIVIEE